MAKREMKPPFAPTPPSSARPTSSRRSARLGRKLIRVDSNPSTQSRGESPNEKATPNDDIESMTRQVSFSGYHVLPPIRNYVCTNSSDIGIKDKNFKKTRLKENDELLNDKEMIANKEVPADEAIASGEMGSVEPHKLKDVYTTDPNKDSSLVPEEQLRPEGRKLYRKGDIFKGGRATSDDATLKAMPEGGRVVGDVSLQNNNRLEPGDDSIQRIHLAFRVPNKSRIDRYFLPTDRIGDLVAFLQHVIFENDERKYMIELFINDFPRRRLDQLTSTLSDASVKDRTVIDVLICDDVGTS